ncbi:MFS general substrate transporter [Exidia glandulosa HHB12029]|uniref:MFS general substrate transporter n=1 Tax=Exidia glandulosa HHB12029 TaxID=1314781 RepID=A0A165ZGR8_EXIGL|nr:MFS general substrate transporter [Exidia glandulosa HHB12029]
MEQFVAAVQEVQAEKHRDVSVVDEKAVQNDSTSPSTSASIKTTAAELRKEWIQFVTLCLCLFLAGWNDGTTGPLLPRIQEFYNLGYTAVSTLFLLQCIGFIIGACAALYLNDKIGFGKSLVLGASCQIIAYIAQSTAPPFPVLVTFSALNGFGLAIQDAQSTGYVAVMRHYPDRKMGALHAVYVSPLVATQFAKLPHRWSFHYMISCALAVCAAIATACVFRFKRQEELLDYGNRRDDGDETEEVDGKNKYRQIFSMRVLHYLAFFMLLYVGIELTMGGWIVTFMLRERNGGSSSGYVASGLYGGLMLGRVVLLPLNEKIGEQRAIFVYAAIAAALDIVVWRIRDLVGDAVAASIMGLFLGPMYPIVMNQAATFIPRHLLTGSIGWIAGVGQVGSAAFPFITGALASRFDILVLPPLILAMIGVMVVLWLLAVLESRKKRV